MRIVSGVPISAMIVGSHGPHRSGIEAANVSAISSIIPDPLNIPRNMPAPNKIVATMSGSRARNWITSRCSFGLG